MSKEDIDRAVKDAEKYAEEDKKLKDAVETKNQAEALIFQSEKTLAELGDKVSEDEKAAVTAELNTLKEAVKGDDTEAIKKAMDAFREKFYALSEKLYKAQAEAQGAAGADNAQGAAGTQNEDGSFNAEYKEK